MKIAIAGMGYVGLSLACLLAKNNQVFAVDIDESRVDKINSGISPIADPEIEECLASGELNIFATCVPEEAYRDADYVIVATPTNYDDATNSFDTSSVENVFAAVQDINPLTTVVIRSTVPVGYTENINLNYDFDILFSPEFLREGRALYDNLHPSRIIIGVPSRCIKNPKHAEVFARILREGLSPEEQFRMNADGSTGIPVLIVGATEAESIKLFSNTYLALRVAYFNELDTFAATQDLDAQQIIKGVSLDPRIGDHYNNPSFGYGGYCLPKDTKQLLSNYHDIPQNLVKAVVDANRTRKNFIVEKVVEKNPQTVGVYRLVMKSGSDNFRESSVLDIIKAIQTQGIRVKIYEPLLDEYEFFDSEVVADLNSFMDSCDVILCNRWNDELTCVKEKVYTRDLWHND